MAFKDLAMQFLGQAVPYVLARRGQVLTILGATSGDTGSAAEEAFRSQQGVSVVMLSPAGRMSEVQRAQMYSITDDNIHNVAVRGVFDDCQNLVKTLMGDADFKTAHHLGAVNSINIGRIAAQAVYYVWTWLRVTDAAPEDVRAGLRVDVAVPSGNFGNIYAAFLARSMGVPLRRLVLATNENNVLDEFFSTGVYRPRDGAETLATSSPSMDISKASNLERFVAQVLGEEFMRYWTRLESDGVLDLCDRIVSLRQEHGFISGTSTHADRLEAIRQVHAATGELIDPHTADGVTVALRVLEADATAPGADNAPGATVPTRAAPTRGGACPWWSWRPPRPPSSGTRSLRPWVRRCRWPRWSGSCWPGRSTSWRSRLPRRSSDPWSPVTPSTDRSQGCSADRAGSVVLVVPCAGVAASAGLAYQAVNRLG